MDRIHICYTENYTSDGLCPSLSFSVTNTYTLSLSLSLAIYLVFQKEKMMSIMPSFYLSTWLNYYPVDLWISSESKELTEEGILTLNVWGGAKYVTQRKFSERCPSCTIMTLVYCNKFPCLILP